MKKAQSLIEYTIILILISMVAVMTLHFLGKKATFKKLNSTQTVTKEINESMTNYCQNKGLTYNEQKQICEQPSINNKTELK